MTDGDVVEKYLWENKTRLLATFDGNNNLKQRYEYTIGNTPTSYTEGSNRYYILTDQLGSPRMVTDEAGTLLREIEYDSFGNIVADSAPEIKLAFGFAGGLYDQHTGLIRFGYRDYDPETGRWTARDPIGFDGGDTNLYGYVLGDPVNGIDPTGEFVWVVGGALVGGAFGAITSAISAASGPGPINWSNVAAQAVIGGARGALAGAIITMNPALARAINIAGSVASAGAKQLTECKVSIKGFVADVAIDLVGGKLAGKLGKKVNDNIFSSFANPAVPGSAHLGAQLGQAIGHGIVGNAAGVTVGAAGSAGVSVLGF
jgi:RHS repeat-associated protein